MIRVIPGVVDDDKIPLVLIDRFNAFDPLGDNKNDDGSCKPISATLIFAPVDH